MRKRIVGLATTALVTGGLGLAGFALTPGTAQAEPGPFPAYHWCPGDDWFPWWGFNWDWGTCHDDHHRDFDGWDHSRDWWGDQGGDRGGWQPWQGDQGGDRGGWQPRQGDQGGDRGGDRGGPQPWQPWQR
jgi:hypothetical protein